MNYIQALGSLSLFALLTLPSPLSMAETPDTPPEVTDTSNACNPAFREQGITRAWLDEQLNRVENQDPSLIHLQTAARRAGFKNVTINESIAKAHNNSYTFELGGNFITNQSNTPRCWTFSGDNMVRAGFLRSGLLPANFEISQNYIWFFSLLERSNKHIENLLSGLSRKYSSAEMQSFLIPGIQGGGFFADFLAIIKKYGVVPKSAMPETSSAMNGDAVLNEINRTLADFSLFWMDERKALDKLKQKSGGSMSAEARAKSIARLAAQKDKTMQAIYQILATHLGVPPCNFSLRLNAPLRRNLVSSPFRTDALELVMTPHELLELSGFDREEWVSVAYLPAKKYGIKYTLPGTFEVTPTGADKPANMEWLNLPWERMETLIMSTLDAGYAVGFGSDVNADIDFTTGIMHPDLYDYDAVYGKVVDRSRINNSRINLNYLMQSYANHAMTIVGYDRPDPNLPPTKLKVANSWDYTAGDNGSLHMYRAWGKKNVTDILIPKRLLNAEEQKAIDAKGVAASWDSLFR